MGEYYTINLSCTKCGRSWNLNETVVRRANKKKPRFACTGCKCTVFSAQSVYSLPEKQIYRESEREIHDFAKNKIKIRKNFWVK